MYLETIQKPSAENSILILTETILYEIFLYVHKKLIYISQSHKLKLHRIICRYQILYY